MQDYKKDVHFCWNCSNANQTPKGYRHPLIFQYICYIKLATLGAYKYKIS